MEVTNPVTAGENASMANPVIAGENVSEPMSWLPSTLVSARGIGEPPVVAGERNNARVAGDLKSSVKRGTTLGPSNYEGAETEGAAVRLPFLDQSTSVGL